MFWNKKKTKQSADPALYPSAQDARLASTDRLGQGEKHYSSLSYDTDANTQQWNSQHTLRALDDFRQYRSEENSNRYGSQPRTRRFDPSQPVDFDDEELVQAKIRDLRKDTLETARDTTRKLQKVH